MRARRPSNRRYQEQFARALQRHRLERIARGDLTPINDREEFFLRALRRDGRADYRDFIVPRSLLLLEVFAQRLGSDPADKVGFP